MRGLDQQASVTVKRPVSNTFHLAPIRFLNHPLGSPLLMVTQSYALPLLSLVTSSLCRSLTRHSADFKPRIKDLRRSLGDSKILIFLPFFFFFFFGKYKTRTFINDHCFLRRYLHYSFRIRRYWSRCEIL